MENPMQTFVQGLQKMQQQEKLVDLFKVHKAVICAQSDYFSAACSNSKFEKGQSGDLITLKAIGGEDGDDKACDDPEIIKLMVHYFYHFDYKVASINITTPDAERSPSSGHLFSDQNRPASAGAGLFGAPNNNQQQNANPFATVGGGLFGNANPQQQTDNRWVFGNQNRPAGLFGGASNNTAGGGPFGNINNNSNQQQQNSGPSLFGTSNNNAGGGLSGSQNKPASGGLFGATVSGSMDNQRETAAETDGNMSCTPKSTPLQSMYTTTPDENRALRSVVVKTLLKYGSLLDKDAVEGLVCGISGLAFELLKGSRQGTTV
ncbi:hypothetical protein LTR27_010665 [Elasticomyces elasticus]|nr:hypothetical protein LTR27_010665 [Elasticomyces elasticus]